MNNIKINNITLIEGNMIVVGITISISISLVLLLD